MSHFIKLTLSSGEEMLFNSVMIVAVQSCGDADSGSVVHAISGDSWVVKETQQQIRNMIENKVYKTFTT